MSRIGKRPIDVPSSVNITIDPDNSVTVKGPKGELSGTFNPEMTLARENGTLTVVRPSDAREHRAIHGLTRTLLANMVTGVTDGFTKVLTIQGVGYRSAMDGRTLVLTVGYSHPVRMEPPEGISFAVEAQTRVTVSGIDKQAVGEQAAQIRRVRPPEPYKGKGIRYDGEVVRRKAGKTGKGK
jgi:large subunit ribosomal protein L6